MDKRKRYDAQFKARIALEAIRGDRTPAEIASAYEVHATQITKWKKQVLEEIPNVFSGARERSDKRKIELVADLYQEIGRLKMELDWLKKKAGLIG